LIRSYLKLYFTNYSKIEKKLTNLYVMNESIKFQLLYKPKSIYLISKEIKIKSKFIIMKKTNFSSSFNIKFHYFLKIKFKLKLKRKQIFNFVDPIVYRILKDCDNYELKTRFNCSRIVSFLFIKLDSNQLMCSWNNALIFGHIFKVF
jgi:hypothetical protein